MAEGVWKCGVDIEIAVDLLQSLTASTSLREESVVLLQSVVQTSSVESRFALAFSLC